MINQFEDKRHQSVVRALVKELNEIILTEVQIRDFKVNDPLKVEHLQNSENAVSIKSRLFFQGESNDGLTLLLKLAAGVVKNAFSGAVEEYQTTHGCEFYPDPSEIQEEDLDAAVDVFERLGVSCRFLAFILAAALSYLGDVVAYSAEIRE